jgi:hypothetical protein
MPAARERSRSSRSDALRALHAFVDEYRKAFTRSDTRRLAELFAFPLQVVSATDDGVEIRAFGRDEWNSVLGALLDTYRSLGVSDGEIAALEVTELGPHIASVHVCWELRRADRSGIYDFTALYTLAQLDGRWRVAGIAHDEGPRLRAVLGR